MGDVSWCLLLVSKPQGAELLNCRNAMWFPVKKMVSACLWSWLKRSKAWVMTQGDGCALTTPWEFSDLVAAPSLVWPSGDCLICPPIKIVWSCGSAGERHIGGLVVVNVLWNVRAAFRLLLKTFCSKRWRVIVSSLSFQPNNADGVHICNPASLSADFNGWLTCSFISWLNLTEWRLAKTDEVFRCWIVLHDRWQEL